MNFPATVKNLKFGTKLRLGFFIALSLPLAAATSFSIIHFGNTIEAEALAKVESDAKTAVLMYQNELAQLQQITNAYANSKGLSVLFNLKISKKLGEQIHTTMLTKHLDLVHVIDHKRTIIARGHDAGKSGDTFPDFAYLKSIFSFGKAEAGLTTFSREFLEKEGIVFSDRFNGVNTMLVMLAMSPILNKDVIAGTIITTRILSLDNSLVLNIHNTTKADVAIFDANQIVTTNLSPESERLKKISTVLLSVNAPTLKDQEYNEQGDLLKIKAIQSVFEGNEYHESFIEQGGYLAHYVPLYDFSRTPIAAFMVSTSADSYVETRLVSFASFGAIAIFGIIFALIIQIILERQVVSPIKLLERGTERLTKGEYDHKIAVEGDDEIGMLASSFNSMAEKLQSNLVELNEYSHSLEAKVTERTYELSKSNQQMMETNEKLEVTLELLNPGVSRLIAEGKQTLGLINATELICDLSNYTRMNMLLGEKLMGELMTSFYRRTHVLLAQYNGFRDKIIGDQIVATFGIEKDYHRASELHAFDAIFFALNTKMVVDRMNQRLRNMIQDNYAEIRNRLYSLAENEKDIDEDIEKLTFATRCGINTSNIATKKEIDQMRMVMMGAETGEDYTGQGGALIYAARLESSGSPGEIHIGENTRRIIDHVAETEELPEIILKGLGSQKRYKIVGIRTIFSNISPNTKFYRKYKNNVPIKVKSAMSQISIGSMHFREVRQISDSFGIVINYLEHLCGVFNLVFARVMFAWSIAEELELEESKKISIVYASIFYETEKLRNKNKVKLKEVYNLEEQMSDHMDKDFVKTILSNARKEKPALLEGEIIVLASLYDSKIFDRTYKQNVNVQEIIPQNQFIQEIEDGGLFSFEIIRALRDLMYIARVSSEKTDPTAITEEIYDVGKADLSDPIRFIYRQEYKEAERVLNALILESSANAEHYFYLAVCCKKQNKVEISIEHYKKALEISPNYHYAAHNLGIIYRELKNWKQSEEYFQKVLELQPDSISTYFEYGKTLILSENIGKLDMIYDKLQPHEKEYQELQKYEEGYSSVSLNTSESDHRIN